MTASLTGSEPADGAVLPAAPASVELDFTAAPDPVLSHISVRDDHGREVNTGEPVRDSGHSLRQSISAKGAGDYSVAFHVQFADGSELTGARFFSAGTGVPPRAGEAERAAAAAATHQHGVDPAGATLLVIDLVVGLVVAVLLMRRPRNAPARAWRL